MRQRPRGHSDRVFCPRAAATLYGTDPEHIAVPVGAFADPNSPHRFSGIEHIG